MIPPPASAHAVAQSLSPRRRTAAFVVVVLAFVMDLLDVTVVNVALPAIQQGLQASPAALQWSVAGYSLAFAVLLVTGGRLGDSLGYRPLFLGGVAAFTLASVLCGLALTPAQLVAGRLLQGASAAAMVPQVMALMQVMYPPAQRFRMFAVFGLLGGVSAALGPVLGGLLIDANPAGLGWRSAFLINLPVGLFSLLAGWWLLPTGRATAPKPVDLTGSAWLTATATALLLPLIQGPELGWPVWCIGLLGASLPLAWATSRAWARRQARDGAALVNPALLALPAVRRGLLASLAVNGVVPAYLLALTFALQRGLAASPAQVALLCMPIAVGAALSIAVLAQHVVPRIGAAAIVLGAGVQAAALVLAVWTLSNLLGQPGIPALDVRLLVAHGLLGLGIGLIGPALTTATLQDVPLAEAGSASGVVSAVQQLAAALALAVVGLLLFRGPQPALGAETLAAGLLLVGPYLVGTLAVGAWAASRLQLQR